MKNHHKLVALVVLVLISIPLLVMAQDYTVHLSQIDTSEYPEVTVYVNVTNETGAHVSDVTQDGFAIWEDDVGVELVNFAGVGEDRPVDVMFVFDTTGSMHEEIDGLKQTTIDFANQLRENNRDFRLGLISFDDHVKQSFNSDGSLTADERQFREWVSRLRAEGGGDGPENAFGAIKAAAQMQFRPDAQVVFVLITDAPAHKVGDDPDEGVRFDDPDLTIERILALLQAEAVTVFPVAFDDADFRQLGLESGGSFYDINSNPDFTGIIDEIGGTIASQYKLTYLSPRPTYDGTMREINVTVNTGGGAMSTGSSEYLEEHMLNIQSSWMIGFVLLVPLVGALMVPYFFTSRASGTTLSNQNQQSAIPPVDWSWQMNVGQPPVADPYPQETPPPQMGAIVSNNLCSQCGAQNRPGARYCHQCRQQLTQPDTIICPHCQNSMRSTARFCQSCGNQVGK